MGRTGISCHDEFQIEVAADRLSCSWEIVAV